MPNKLFGFMTLVSVASLAWKVLKLHANKQSGKYVNKAEWEQVC